MEIQFLHLALSLVISGSPHVPSRSACQKNQEKPPAQTTSTEFSPAYLERLEREAGLRRERLAKAQSEVAKHPDLAEAHLRLAEAYSEDPADSVGNDYDVIAGEYKKAIRLKPDFPEAFHGLAKMYGYLNEYRKQFAAFRKAMSLSPRNAELCRDLGYAHLWDNIAKSGMYPDFTRELRLAAKAFRRAIQLRPEYSDAFRGLGEAYYYLEKYEEAVQAYQEAIHFEPNSIPGHAGLGRAFIELGRKAEAMDQYRSLVRISREPSDNEALRFIAEGAANVLLGEIKKRFENR